MPGTSITGGWARANVVKPLAALKPAIDPEHLDPTDNPQYAGTTPLWVENTVKPGLPAEVLAANAWERVPIEAGIGPLDLTPEDHNYGMGIGPAMSTEAAQEYRGSWHMDDQGAPLAHHWVPLTYRDGEWVNQMAHDQQLDGDSFEQLQLKRTGIGQPNDPEASARQPSRRFRRWVNRYIDMHRYVPEPGPVRPQYAVPVPGRQAVPAGNQLTPPWGNNVQYPPSQALTPDKFTVETMRRSPGDWVSNQITDGTDTSLQGAGNTYSLTNWGL
jgi:hypothetical protein